MRNLIGKSFSIADHQYLIVDVQRLGGDALVYAERVEAAGACAGARTRPSPDKTAFHYGDIAELLETAPQA